MDSERFVSFTITHLETDLWIGIHPASFRSDIPGYALNLAKDLRREMDRYIDLHPLFLSSLTPLPPDRKAHVVIQKMIAASVIAGTGPMSAVAGAFSQFIGEALIDQFGVREIIVENGGDIYLSIQKDLEVGIFAGKSPLSNQLAVVVPSEFSPLGLCTSSGTVGPSLSFGKADAVTIACSDASLADALATRFGNEVKTPKDIQKALQLSEDFRDILSILIIAEDQIGVKGKLAIKPMA